MKDIQVKKCFSDAHAAMLESTKLDENAYDLLLRNEAVRVFKPDGSLLLQLCPAAIPAEQGRTAFEIFQATKLQTSKNRGSAMGKTFKRPYIKADGKQSRTVQSVDESGKTLELDSSVIGYFDRNARYPFCRQTTFNQKYPDRWRELQPFIRTVDRAFATHVPDRYAVQRAIADRTAQDFIIKGTAFSTITVNKSWQTAVHKDAGDLKDGFGVMGVLRSGHYRGCHLVMPQYRIAVDLQSCDLLLFDVHEWHGNTPLVGREGAYQRISCVFYYREKMIGCGTAAQELHRAKNRKPGDPIWD